MPDERRVTQYEIDRQARDHLEGVAVLLDRLGGIGDQCAVGYVEEGEDGGLQFSDMGWSTLRAARILAWDSATYLDEEVLALTTGHQDRRLLSDVQNFLAVASCAFDGMKVNETTLISGPAAASALRSMAWDLRERADAEDEPGEPPKPPTVAAGRLDPTDIPEAARHHAETLTGLLGLLLAGASGGYVAMVSEDGELVDRLTPEGYRLAENAHALALAAATQVFDSSGRIPGTDPNADVLDALASDAAKALAVVASALGGLPAHPEPCLVTGGLRSILRDLVARCERAEAAIAEGEAGPPSTVDATPAVSTRVDTSPEPEEEKARERQGQRTDLTREPVGEPAQKSKPDRARDRAAEAAGAPTDRVGALRGAADSVLDVCDDLRAVNRPNVEMLGVLRALVLDLSRIAWTIESLTKPEDLPKGWGHLIGGNVLHGLPALLPAISHAVGHPDEPAFFANFSGPWRWCVDHATDLAKEVVAWADEHHPAEA